MESAKIGVQIEEVKRWDEHKIDLTTLLQYLAKFAFKILPMTRICSLYFFFFKPYLKKKNGRK